MTSKKIPDRGSAIGKNCYKTTYALIASLKEKAREGGARIVTNFVVTDQTVYLLSIYDKADKENITYKELDELLEIYPQ